MTEFEETKAELHKLVDNLDVNKILETNKQLELIYYHLVGLQKEPTLEEQLQELGFVINSGRDSDKSLAYSIVANNTIIWLYRELKEEINHRITLPLKDKNKVLECAKFLKELVDEN